VADETTIPILPCASINDMLTFYTALGFEITYQQARPNAYACVRRGSIELHFFTMRDYQPENSYSTCLVVIAEADAWYRAFAAGLRQHYGKLLVAGIPRLTPLRNKAEGGRGFNVIDPGGNWIRFVQKTANPEASEPEAHAAPTRLSRAVRAAELLADSKGDYAEAAKTLDKALAAHEAAPSVHRIQALVLRANLGITMGDTQLARRLLAEVDGIALDEVERRALEAEFNQARDLRAMLG
jgi:catechol 2,3-dioxygenase-like lactoylglutathione lyase family enzyme